MKAAASIALLFCTSLSAQQNSANRTIAVTTAPEENFFSRLLRPLEPEHYTPISGKTRLREYVGDTFGPYTIFREAAAAAVSQAMNSPHEWGGGTEGYAERFASNMGFVLVHNTIAYGLSSAFHEDNRYFASGKNGKMRRALHAALSPFEARHDDGHVGFSYSNVTGVVGASLISRAWAPPSWRGGENIGKTIGYTFAGQAAFNIFREFLPDLLHHR
jgi:hypothetical protein